MTEPIDLTNSRLKVLAVHTSEGGSSFAGAHNFTIEQQFNTENVFNHVTNIIHKEFDIYQELQELTEATHVRDRKQAPPDSRCLPGTRKKLIKQIQSWVNSGILLKGVPSHVMWLYGYVGCGKSAIAQTIADKFAKKNRLAASFFFFRSTGDRSRTVRFPTTMAAQIAKAIPLTKLFVEDAWKTYRSSLASTPVHIQFLHLFLNPFHSAIRNPKRMAQSHLSGPYLTVIDGLDECEDRQDIASLIDQINEFFKDNPRFPLRFNLWTLSNKPQEEEIAYIVNEIFKNAAEHNWVVKSYGNWPNQDARRKLVKYTDGSLLLLSMVTQFILEPTNDGRTPKERLTIALDNKLGLDEIYAEVLSRSEQYRYFDIIIPTLALSRRQHSISALAHLLGIDQGDVILVLQNLHAIFYVPGDEYSPVTFSHSSLREFLCSEERAQKYFAAPSHHKFLAHRFYANMESINDIPSKERVDDATGSFRYHWKLTIAPHLTDPLRLKEELQALLSIIRHATSPSRYTAIHWKLAAFALLDRDWVTKLLPRSRRECFTEELVARFTNTRVSSMAWLNITALIGALKEPLQIVESRLGPVNLVDEFQVLCERVDTPGSRGLLPLLAYHTYLAITCMKHLFIRPKTPLGEAGLCITLMPLQDEPIRSGQAHPGEFVRHVSGYSFWSFGVHLAKAIEHDRSLNQTSLLEQHQPSVSTVPREEMSAFEFLLCQSDYHATFDDPGEYLPMFKANFERASESVGAVLPEVDSLGVGGNWGFVNTPRKNGSGRYLVYGCFKDDYSILNLWAGYSLLARCLVAKMEKEHDDSTCVLHQKYGEARGREGHV
ncbi:hypothetical protein FA13DRAFT_1793098 [Coprinellus micaceus]|uniref:Nephrocystin 3-like N-terminal domain-containing protein n=1 Tax=Coprinellus micaceus TaxID=71717 RepID=A0A4Y7T5X2_COPMI|nr:hypothetical protein FA13DRAFT_1793098 [Coprinellus micaceus]